MPINLTQLDTDFAAVIVDLPSSFQCLGVAGSCVLTDVAKGDSLQLAGFNGDLKANAYIRNALFSVLPSPGITLYTAGQTYRVDSVSQSPDMVSINVGLVSVNQ